jgi:hypothetical protein
MRALVFLVASPTCVAGIAAALSWARRRVSTAPLSARCGTLVVRDEMLAAE